MYIYELCAYISYGYVTITHRYLYIWFHYYYRTCNQEDSYTTVDSSRLNNENKMKNMKIQLENYKQRVECMLKMNQQIQSELNKSVY